MGFASDFITNITGCRFKNIGNRLLETYYYSRGFNQFMKYQDFFKNKKITLMGLGLLGRGIGDAKFLAKYAKQLTITDLKTKKELGASINKLSGFKNIKFVLGYHDLSDFRNADMVIKGAGVPLDSPFIKGALKNKV